MTFKLNYLTLLLPFTMVLSISAQATVINYGENLSSLKKAFSDKNVHILQIGDSHTAGDYFTEKLRKRLQQEVGDGGVGFMYPSKLKGQRNARHGYVSNWNTSNSKYNKKGGNYPVGGVIASSASLSNKLTVTSKYYAQKKHHADTVVYGKTGDLIRYTNRFGSNDIYLQTNGWQKVSLPMIYPTTIQATPNVSIGGFWSKKHTKQKNAGGIVSTMGINGATQDYWKRWNSDIEKSLRYSEANMVILAYGTNEAFRNNASTLTIHMNKAIAKIRRALPNATILIAGAPESLKSTSGSCGIRATSLDSVQAQLRNVAQSNRTLYWSWQNAMGGKCSMKSWIRSGLAARDGVHFTRKGYDKSANNLYNGLIKLISTNQTSVSNKTDMGSSSVTYTNFSNTNTLIKPQTTVNRESIDAVKNSYGSKVHTISNTEQQEPVEYQPKKVYTITNKTIEARPNSSSKICWGNQLDCN